jgi:hypothetical protein|tara:strand:+ start:632 stop:2611 length:1980 start_codon:yes stop_codon:yes gene_type:complete
MADISLTDILTNIKSGNKKLITNEIVADRLKNNKSKKTFKQLADSLNEEGYYNRAGKITKASLEKRAQQLNLTGFGSKPQNLNTQSLYEFSRPENIKLYEEGKITEDIFRQRAKGRKNDLARKGTDKFIEYRKKINKKYREDAKKPGFEDRAERLKRDSANSRAAHRLKYGAPPPATNAKEELWRGLFTNGQEYKPGKRLKTIGDYKGSITRKQMYNAKILDTKTGKTFTFNNLEKYITPENTGFTYKQTIKPYEQKWFINNTPGLRTEINQKLLPNYKKGTPANFFEIQHNAGKSIDPFDVSLSNKEVNLKEYLVRNNFEKKWSKAKTLTEKKAAFKNYVNELPEIVSKPNMVKRNRSFGKNIEFSEQLKNIQKRGVKINPEVLEAANKLDNFKKSVSRLKGAQLGTVCRTLTKAIPMAKGGRVNFASGGGAVANCLRLIDKNPAAAIRAVSSISKGSGKLKSTINVARLAKGVGYGILAELAIAGPLAVADIRSGESGKRTLGNATYGLLGQTSKEEEQEFLGEKGFRATELMRRSQGVEDLDVKAQESFNPEDDMLISDQITMSNKSIEEQIKAYTNQDGSFNEEQYSADYNTGLAGLKNLQDAKKFRKEAIQKNIANTQDPYANDFMAARGGIATLPRRVAKPNNYGIVSLKGVK